MGSEVLTPLMHLWEYVFVCFYLAWSSVSILNFLLVFSTSRTNMFEFKSQRMTCCLMALAPLYNNSVVGYYGSVDSQTITSRCVLNMNNLHFWEYDEPGMHALIMETNIVQLGKEVRRKSWTRPMALPADVSWEKLHECLQSHYTKQLSHTWLRLEKGRFLLIRNTKQGNKGKSSSSAHKIGAITESLTLMGFSAYHSKQRFISDTIEMN